MKLIDILVRELKEWPADAEYLTQSILDKELYKTDGAGDDVDNLNSPLYLSKQHDEEIFSYPVVSKEQWQAAVAEANKGKVWNGEGLPPVGAKVRVCRGICFWREVDEWLIGGVVTVILVFLNKNGYNIATIELDDGNCTCVRIDCLRPFRTPEQISAEEREQTIKDLYYTINSDEDPAHWKYGVSERRKADYAKAVDVGYRKQVNV